MELDVDFVRILGNFSEICARVFKIFSGNKVANTTKRERVRIIQIVLKIN